MRCVDRRGGLAFEISRVTRRPGAGNQVYRQAPAWMDPTMPVLFNLPDRAASSPIQNEVRRFLSS